VSDAFFTRWRKVPQKLRRFVVCLLGGTVILLGLLLIVLPGPFTIPLVAAGAAILSTEYEWAKKILDMGEQKVRSSGLLFRRYFKVTTLITVGLMFSLGVGAFVYIMGYRA
jgi:hypothetical protein